MQPGTVEILFPLIERITADALGDTRYAEGFARTCDAVAEAGLPLLRSHLSMRVLHPLVESVDLTWLRGTGLEVHNREYVLEPRGRWLQSPLYWMMTHRQPELHLDLREPANSERFPVFEELRQLGGTDYFAMLTPFGDPTTAIARQDGILTSWVADGATGFSPRDIDVLRHLQPYVGLVAKLAKHYNTAQNVVMAYLGEDVGRQVLEGRIRLGDVERIPAVIWFSDLRNSTAMAREISTEAFLVTVNDYFHCTAGAVLECGGQVLRFIGDAVLAVFPIAAGEAPRRAAEQAMAASRDAGCRLQALNQQRAEKALVPLSFGLGLHVGEVLYGNIGVANRLEFSVIGSAANEASRVESLTKELGEPVLATNEFVQALPGAWRALGRQQAKGMADGLEVFAPQE